MRHYVLFKFKPRCFTEDLLNYIKDAYTEIEKLENIEEANVYCNCVERDLNMDIMIELKLKDKDTLKYYLESDLHKNFAKNLDDRVLTRVSFDCE